MAGCNWLPGSLALVVAVSSLFGCAGRFDPAHFEGKREERRVEPEAIVDLAARSREVEVLGTTQVSCTLAPGFRRLDDELLSNVDCSGERLDFVLRESAASAGGEALIGEHCYTRRVERASRETYRVYCSAEVGRFAGGALASRRPLSVPRSLPAGLPAPSSSEVRRIDEPDASLAFRIALDFEPSVKTFARRARRGDEVSELATMPLFDCALGDLRARCEDGCDERALRRSVLVAAGRLGAPDVIAVRCFRDESGDSCVGTLAAPELEE
ncbi:MAG TPA: hypothetical protein VHV51_23970 [Polyangiaceae bacterium]|jgi:hypothetical protein|nr:hypothetical protein [Polyangiaceae bacterium]